MHLRIRIFLRALMRLREMHRIETRTYSVIQLVSIWVEKKCSPKYILHAESLELANNEISEFGIASGYTHRYVGLYSTLYIFVHAHASHGYTKQVYPQILSLGE